MSPKYLALAIAVAIPFLAAGEALARRVTHVVTPASIDKLPFIASVKVKDGEKLREVEITITWILARPSVSLGG